VQLPSHLDVDQLRVSRSWDGPSPIIGSGVREWPDVPPWVARCAGRSRAGRCDGLLEFWIGKKSGRPSCTDTSARASLLAGGCEKDGKPYKAIVTHCVDGRTRYNVPGVPPHGASGFSDGTLRSHAVSQEEVVHCVTGETLSS